MNDQNNFDDVQLILNQFRKKNPSTAQVAKWKNAVLLTQQNNLRGESAIDSSDPSSHSSSKPRVILAKPSQGFSWSQLMAASIVGFTIGAMFFGRSIFLQSTPSMNDSVEIALQSPEDATFEHIITKN